MKHLRDVSRFWMPLLSLLVLSPLEGGGQQKDGVAPGQGRARGDLLPALPDVAKIIYD
jgi:hypothetical protein